MNINPLIPESLDFTIEKISTTGVLPYRKEQASPSTRADSFPAQKRIILLGSLPSPESPSTPGHSIVASGQVDDSIKLTVCKDEYQSASGAGVPVNKTFTGLWSGLHVIDSVHDNIDYNPPSGNIAFMRFDVTGCDEVEVTPLYDGQPIECDCSCGCSCGDNGDGCDSDTPAASSSAGQGFIFKNDPKELGFCFNFGSIKGSELPVGRLALLGRAFEAGLLSPSALAVDWPTSTRLIVPSGGVAKNELVRLVEGANYLNFACCANGDILFPVGSSKNTATKMAFVNCESREESDDVECQLDVALYVRAAKPDQSALFFDKTTGAFVSLITASGEKITAAQLCEFFDARYDASGAIRQLYSKHDGLTDIVSEGSGYAIKLYTPAQVTHPASSTELYTATGAAFKQFVISGDTVAQSLCVQESSPTSPSLPARDFAWSYADALWSLLEGSGSDAIFTEHTPYLEPEASALQSASNTDGFQCVKTVRRGDAIASRELQTWEQGPRGKQLVSVIAGYGSDNEQTTLYAYDDCGRLIKTTNHDGGVYKTLYDSNGRPTLQSSPWGTNGEQRTDTVYRNDGSPYSMEPASVKTWKGTASGIYALRTDLYSYSEAGSIKRVEVRSSSRGNALEQLSITETWLASAENSFARGRTRMSQGINGVQTWYDYAATSLHGAAYTVSSESKVAGQLVLGQSEKEISYIDAQGNTVREESYVYTNEGAWKLISSATHSYDVQNRRIATTHGNGRSSSQALTCTGAPLWQIDENGVRTDYAYNSARQLIETTRAATESTPETIVEYVKDAAGRSLSSTTHVGAMSSTSSQSYDALGRLSSSTDALGRVTSYAYSADGLTTTVTTPSGATLISVKNLDGSPAHQSGTGQRELYYAYDIHSNGERSTVKLGDNSTIVSQQIINGFGQTITETMPTSIENTYGYNRYEYNALGQLIKQRLQGGTQYRADTLFAYDSMGNQIKRTLVLNSSDPTSVTLNRIVESSVSYQEEADGIYQVQSQRRYNAAGDALTSSQKQLISRLSATLESKSISIDERGLSSITSSAYDANSAVTRLQSSTSPYSNIVATATVLDGFMTAQSDHAGVQSSFTRAYTATGMILTQTDGRGNTSTSITDLAGRTLSITDAAGNTTSTSYCSCCDNPASITDALGNSINYAYDIRGRKTAEWGTATQPACYAYDDADNLTQLRTFRVNEGDISSNPSERTDGDTTTWSYDPATGLELSKTYADNTQELKSYNAFNQVLTQTDARGHIATHSYALATGELTGISYSNDSSPAQAYSYNHLGQLTQVTDAAGTRSIAYNDYSEIASDSLAAGGKIHLITEQRDALGRSRGYSYAKDGSTQQTVSTAYAADGRVQSAGFLHSGTERNFEYGYLANSHLLHSLSMPNGMSLVQSYETQRDLLTSMAYHRGATLVSQRDYLYDALGRPTSRTRARQGTTKQDSFAYDTRSQLTAATVDNGNYAYGYDNIGNRKTAEELAAEITYDSNALNQYTAISKDEATPFIPSFDASGNQTLVQTSTGIWAVEYNAENRPITFTQGDTLIECAYDYMGRRATKKVTTNGSVTLHHRYIYRGYLQIACCDLLRSAHPCLWLITWEPLHGGIVSQPTATRPLAIQKDGTFYTYGWDLTKNICEAFNTSGGIAAAYTYTPFGSVSKTGSITQPIQWSAEFADEELSLVYYNYRSYNPTDGRWINRDPIGIRGGLNLYGFIENGFGIDELGLNDIIVKHIRTHNGKFGTYGKITIKTANTAINKCCKLPKSYLTIELPDGSTDGMKFRSKKSQGLIDIENSIGEGASGKTCPRDMYNIYYADTPKSKYSISKVDYDRGQGLEFRIKQPINLHAGQCASGSKGCILIGSRFRELHVNGNPKKYPNTSIEKQYSIPGFSGQDTMDSYSHLMESMACVMRYAKVKKLTVQYSREESLVATLTTPMISLDEPMPVTMRPNVDENQVQKHTPFLNDSLMMN